MHSAPPIFISHAMLHDVQAICLKRYPDEACGILIGQDVPNGRYIREIREATNVWSDGDQRTHRYLLDPATQMRAERDAEQAGLAVIGFFHSHPDAAPRPSSTDLSAAWPVYSYLIVQTAASGQTTAACWRLAKNEDEFEAQEIVVGDY